MITFERGIVTGSSSYTVRCIYAAGQLMPTVRSKQIVLMESAIVNFWKIFTI